MCAQTQFAERILFEGSRTSHSFERSGYAGSIERRCRGCRVRADPLSDAQGRIRRNKKVLRSARFRLPFLPSTDTTASSNTFPGYRLNGKSKKFITVNSSVSGVYYVTLKKQCHAPLRERVPDRRNRPMQFAFLRGAANRGSSRLFRRLGPDGKLVGGQDCPPHIGL
jgi:hypothetical protein